MIGACLLGGCGGSWLGCQVLPNEIIKMFKKSTVCTGRYRYFDVLSTFIYLFIFALIAVNRRSVGSV